MSQTAAFSQRLAAFKENFKNLVTRKHHGYDELSQGQLERPLVGGDESDRDDSFAARHGGAGPGTYQGPVPGYEGGGQYGQGVQTSRPTQDRAGGAAGYIPSQGEDLRQLAGLSKDAAELLWEMAVMADSGEAVQEMLEKAKLLQAQLRGMIGDYNDTDEAALATGLEAFDLLNRSLEEYETVSSPKSGAAPPVFTNSGGVAYTLAPPPGHPAPAPVAVAPPPVDNERPLIEF